MGGYKETLMGSDVMPVIRINSKRKCQKRVRVTFEKSLGENVGIDDIGADIFLKTKLFKSSASFTAYFIMKKTEDEI